MLEVMNLVSLHKPDYLGILKQAITFVPSDYELYVGVAFDSREPSFRKELQSEYKAHRPPTPSVGSWRPFVLCERLTCLAELSSTIRYCSGSYRGSVQKEATQVDGTNLMQALNYQVICESGVEADDVVATYAAKADAEGHEVRVLSLAPPVELRRWFKVTYPTRAVFLSGSGLGVYC